MVSLLTYPMSRVNYRTHAIRNLHIEVHHRRPDAPARQPRVNVSNNVGRTPVTVDIGDGVLESAW
jgi:hypothetical protein